MNDTSQNVEHLEEHFDIVKIYEATPGWVRWLIILIVCVSVNIHVTSIIANRVLNESITNASQMIIEDEKSFTDLQTYFENRYQASASVSYLLQPKSYVKLYKQCIFTSVSRKSLNLIVPTKINLTLEAKFQNAIANGQYVRIDKDSNYENAGIIKQNKAFKTAYVFPIYQHQVHVAELILLYESDKTFTDKELIEITSEIQSMSPLIQ